MSNTEAAYLIANININGEVKFKIYSEENPTISINTSINSLVMAVTHVSYQDAKERIIKNIRYYANSIKGDNIFKKILKDIEE